MINEKQHDNNFNLLRLIGACCVIFSHSFYITGNDAIEPINAITHGAIEASAIGLVIFFFISGYFVTKSAHLSRSIQNFIKKRVFRIYPALIVCVLLSVFVVGALFTELSTATYFTNLETYKYLLTASAIVVKMELPGVFQNTAFYQHAFNSSLWTISLEIKLYLSLGLIIIVTSMAGRKKIFKFIPPIIFITSALLLLFYKNFDYTWQRNMNLITVFYFGSFVYALSLSKRTMVYILLSSIALYFATIPLKGTVNNEVFLWIMISAITYLIGTFSKIKINLETDISYGLYIYAFPIQQTVFFLLGYNTNVLLNLFLSFGITALVALLSWKYVEKPFIQLKNK